MPPQSQPLPGFRVLAKYDLALVLSVVALYNEVFFGSARIIGRDVLHYLIPVGAALHDGLVGRGSLLWDGSVDHGLPVIARWSPMVFYPAQWLHAFFVPATAITIGILAHLMIAASAFMRLALRYTSSVPAACAAAFCFVCGGYVLSLSVGGGYMFGATLLPLSLLAVHRLAEGPRIARMGQLAAVLTLQIFCADPQTLLYEGVFLVPVVLAFHGNATRVRRFGMGALAAAIAVGISTCQWLPSIEFSRLSVRAGGLSFDAQDVWAFHPYRFAQFISPHIFGAVTPQNTFWARSLVNADLNIPWAPYLYNGLLPWVGMLVLPWRRPSRALAVIAGLTLFFVALSFGASTPLFHAVLTFLPGAKFFRYPEKFLLFVSIGICLLGAIGLGRLLEDLLSDEEGGRGRRMRVVVALGALAITAVGLRVWLDPLSQARLEWFAGVIARQRSPLHPGPPLAMMASSLVHTAVVSAVIVAICLIARRLRPRVLLFLGALIALADVLPASLTQRYLADGNSYTGGTPASCSAIPPDGSGVPPLVWRYDTPMYFQEPPGPHEGSRFERQRKWEWDTLMANTGVAHCVRHAQGYEAARLKSHILLWQSMWENIDRRLSLFGVRYVIAARASVDPAHFPAAFISDELNATIHSVPDPLPYAHPLGSAEQVSNVDGAIKRLLDPAFDFHRTVLFERTTGAASFPDATRRATVRSYQNGDITIDVDFAAAGYLLLQETYYPGWRAELDPSHPIAVERANATFIGVELPAGTHTVRFVFDPILQKQANGVSLGFLSLLAVLMLGTAGWAWRRGVRRVA